MSLVDLTLIVYYSYYLFSFLHASHLRYFVYYLGDQSINTILALFYVILQGNFVVRMSHITNINGISTS